MNEKKTLAGYIIAAANCRLRLPSIIEQWSKMGYELWGNPFVYDARKGQGQEICQVMVKYE